MERIVRTSLWLFLLLSLAGCKTLSSTQIAPSQPPTSTILLPTSTNPLAVSTDSSTPLPTPLKTRDITALPSYENLTLGWNILYPGGETACARGGTYSFSVRKTNSSKLLVYFKGGGTCYDSETCRVGGNYFDDTIDYAFEADNPSLKSYGLFNFENPRNPFRDHNIVFINYCTGDAYFGDRSVTYQYGTNTYQVQHNGFINTQTVFSWIYQNFPSPDSIYMVGCSAGVVGSFFHLPYFKQHYLKTPLTIVGDSGGGFFDGPASHAKEIGAVDLLPTWLPQYQNLISDDILRIRYIFTIPALAYPDIRIGLVDSQEDGVQAEIISRFNSTVTLKAVLESNTANLQSEAPGIQSFIGPGDFHCITMNDNYYDYQANGIQLNDWMMDLASPGP